MLRQIIQQKTGRSVNLSKLLCLVVHAVMNGEYFFFYGFETCVLSSESVKTSKIVRFTAIIIVSTVM